MQLIEAFKLAFQSLWGNKLRSILTLIGVVMGVASVIMVITLLNGANKYVSTKLSGYGADVFTVTRMPSVIFSGEEYWSCILPVIAVEVVGSPSWHETEVTSQPIRD